MKRKEQLRRLGFKPQDNGSWERGSQRITARQVIRSNDKAWTKIMFKKSLDKPDFLLELLKKNPEIGYEGLIDIFGNDQDFDRAYQEAFPQWVEIRDRPGFTEWMGKIHNINAWKATEIIEK